MSREAWGFRPVVVSLPRSVMVVGRRKDDSFDAIITRIEAAVQSKLAQAEENSGFSDEEQESTVVVQSDIRRIREEQPANPPKSAVLAVFVSTFLLAVLIVLILLMTRHQ